MLEAYTLLDRQTGHTAKLSLSTILKLVGTGNKRKWIEALLQTGKALILCTGDVLNWDDPDNGECSTDVTIIDQVLIYDLGDYEDKIISCSSGDVTASELY
jgi:hypothetical protein